MNTGHLVQGQALSAVGTPDYNGEGAHPHVAGQFGCESITVSRMAGPMGWYDCAHIVFEDGAATAKEIIIPLHQCDYIAL